MDILNRDTLSSLDVLEQINLFRNKEDRNDLAHGDLLKIIRIEFQEEIDQGNISLVEYKDKKGEMRPMFILSIEQSKQILLRESVFVRKSILKYIKELEATIKLLIENKLDKKQQIEAMKKFGNLLPEIECKDAVNYMKANTIVNKSVSNFFGFPKMIKKDEMSPDMIIKRAEVMSRFLVAFELFKCMDKAKDFVYDEFKQVRIDYESEYTDFRIGNMEMKNGILTLVQDGE